MWIRRSFQFFEINQALKVFMYLLLSDYKLLFNDNDIRFDAHYMLCNWNMHEKTHMTSWFDFDAKSVLRNAISMLTHHSLAHYMRSYILV